MLNILLQPCHELTSRSSLFVIIRSVKSRIVTHYKRQVEPNQRVRFIMTLKQKEENFLLSVQIWYHN